MQQLHGFEDYNTEQRLKVFQDRYAWKDETSWYERVNNIIFALQTLPEFKLLFSKEQTGDLINALHHFHFVPGGRVLHTIGTDRKGTLYNCLTLPRPDDSIEGIMSSATELALALKAGAGVGIRLDSLRPRGSNVRGSGGKSSGSVAFADLFDRIVGTINQGGSRRGAMLLAHHILHQDVEEFIDAKQDLRKWNNTNITVFCDKESIASRPKVWDKIIHNAWATGEPGVLFLDNVNSIYQGTRFGFSFEGVNACSEVLLPAYGVCLLGSLNLEKDLNIKQTTNLAVKFLHLCHLYALKHNLVPLQQCREVIEKTFKIGLGVMGLAHCFVKNELIYGSDDSLSLLYGLFSEISREAYTTSAEIAKKLNYTSTFNGRANLDLLSCPPTGTTSILAGTTNGIEPIFRGEFERTDRTGTHIVKDKYFDMYGNEKYYVDASQINPLDRVKVQATIQEYLDNAISSTVNLPHEATEEQVKEIYETAHKLGCVSITVYRDKCREGVMNELKESKVHAVPTQIGQETTDYIRPQKLQGTTFKFTFGVSNVYVTINTDTNCIKEVFVASTGINEPWAKAATILLSRLLQKGDDVEKLVKRLKQINGDVTCFVEGEVLSSQPAAIAYALEQILHKHIPQSKKLTSEPSSPCPNCGSNSLQKVGKCSLCYNCNYESC